MSRDTAVLIECAVWQLLAMKYERSKVCSTSRVRKSGIRRAILGLRAKVWIPSSRCAILGLRKIPGWRGTFI